MSILTFLLQNIAVVGGIVLVLILIMVLDWYEGEQQKLAVSITDAIKYVNSGTHQWVDVRSLNTFNQGHIMHAKHLSQLSKDQKKNRKQVIAYCQDGKQAQQWAKAHQASFLQGGIDAWLKEMLPVESIKKEESTA